MFENILCQVTEYDPDILKSLIGLAVELAREGREGRRAAAAWVSSMKPKTSSWAAMSH
jgi:hypothetical protein